MAEELDNLDFEGPIQPEPKRPLPEAAKKFCYKPGVSGNPGGRTKTKPFKQALLRRLNLKPGETFEPKNELEKLADQLVSMALATDKKGKASKLRALKETIDRVDGKAMPSQEELESNKSSKVILISSTATPDTPTTGE